MDAPARPCKDPSRRRLLLAAAAIALARAPGSLLASPREPATAPRPLPAGSGAGRDVLVLGAGIAGLVAAHELQRAGCRVRVLEARQRVGGRCWTIRGGDRFTELGGAEQLCGFSPGEYLNAGANRILPRHRGVLDYVHRLGLPLELLATGPMSETWLLRRAPGHPLSGRPIRFRQLDQDEIGYAMQRLVELMGPAAAGESAELAAWARQFGALDAAGHYQGSPSRGYRVPPGDAVSPGELERPFPAADVWSYGPMGDLPAQIDSAVFPLPTLTLTGGMDRLAKALADSLQPDTIRLGAELVRLRQDEHSVVVTWRDLTTGTQHEERAAHVICTIPFILLSRIDTDLDPAIKGIVGALAYAPVVKVAVDFGRRFWEQEDHIYGGYSFIDDPALMVIYPSAGLGSAGGVVTNYYHRTRGALRMEGLTPDERARAGLSDIELLHPNARADFRSAVSVAWSRIPWNAGCYGGWTENARKRDLPRVAAGDRRVLFAGEHVSQVPAWMEGAVQSAQAALTLLGQQWQAQPEARS